MIVELSAAATDPTPWWQTSLIAGIAAVIGAGIALLSSYLSDRRKLERDDRRQWDKEIRDAYVSVAAIVGKIGEFRWHPLLPATLADMNDDQRMQATLRHEAVAAHLGELEALQNQLRLIASPRVTEKMEKLVETARRISGSYHDRLRVSKYPFIDLAARREELFSAVQENLRLGKYQSYIRPPMSRLTKAKLWITTRVDPITSGEKRWYQGKRFYWIAGGVVVALIGLVAWWIF